MQVLIVEDEGLSADRLEKLIHRYDPAIEVLDKLPSVEKVTRWLDAHPLPDLIFMDIHLMDGTCFDILEQRSIDCPVIFTTAFDQYAMEAFRMQSIDYLMKPVSYRKLEAAFRKFFDMRDEFRQQIQREKFDRILTAVESTSKKTRFMVKSGTRIFSVPLEEIAYFFSEDKITFLVTWEGKKYSINYSLDQLEEMLDPGRFFRASRQVVLHINCIKMVHQYFKGRLKVEVEPNLQLEVIVSSRRAAGFKEWLDQ